MNWQPSAEMHALRARARMNQQIRQFFAARDVLEVETPVLASAPVSDPNIEPMCTTEQRWLQTSPEYAMKRLLCAGSGDIFQIARVFRRGEAGRRHNPEFSLLEWYRVGFDHRRLMDEVAELVTQLLSARYPQLPRLNLSYGDAMSCYAGLEVHSASDEQIAVLGQQLAGQDLQLSRDGWLDVIMSHQVEPSLPADTLVFIDDFPASQAALARVSNNTEGVAVAQRFELYFNGAELANGYHELTDAEEQRRRFVQEAGGRPIDEYLLAALEHGLPDCAGVAMGLDRLLMLVQDSGNIADVLSFDWSRA
ncbi:EF-P lysine aminoacylase EpmA [Thalassolituus sp. C2-1]|uniref:EF-P lysine aminoacylase EpmA n=1 Tax=Venatorbacter sp. C2-1 TaxID=2597518 RepID=UPI00118F30B5|nr:EF-P lysine aminoacylase EpmA [Thalassolituus sp. C2-1]TVV42800.1 EF-P lysine aminoacylase GenX [Thalassolituus sp. C2-1]